MFSIWSEGPRTWKWAVPAAITILLVPITGLMLASPDADTQFWAMVPGGFCVLCFAVSASNYWKWFTTHLSELDYEHQRALSITPLVLLSESMKQMHPDAVRVLNRFGVRTSWQVRVNSNFGTRDWVLADTNVHFGFIEYVLSKSGVALYPKNRFNDGSKRWDPDGLVEDREQYDELEKWMFARMMVTRSFGEYKPAQFIPPWTPALILETMGLTGEQDLYRPEEDLKAKDLDKPENGRQEMGGRGQVRGERARADEQVRDVTEEESSAIQMENLAYAEKYQS